MPASEGEQDRTGGRLVPWPTIHPSVTPILFGYLELAESRGTLQTFLNPQWRCKAVHLRCTCWGRCEPPGLAGDVRSRGGEGGQCALS